MNPRVVLVDDLLDENIPASSSRVTRKQLQEVVSDTASELSSSEEPQTFREGCGAPVGGDRETVLSETQLQLIIAGVADALGNLHRDVLNGAPH